MSDAATVEQRELRDVLGSFATGVTIVTTRTSTGPVGIVANSFASVSLDPPLVLWSIDRRSQRFDAFAGAGSCAIHVLGADQKAAARAFVASHDAFDAFDTIHDGDAPPLIEGCLARLECDRFAAHDGGDHLILVSRVRRLMQREGDPLVFWGGAFGDFTRR